MTKNIKKRFFIKILFGLGFILGFSIVSVKSFAIDLEFDDNMLNCFPCAEYAHYDVWFNATGNDFDGVIIWSGAIDLPTPEVLGFSGGVTNPCPLFQCDNDVITCNKQVVGLYYDKARGERIWPMDQNSLNLLQNPTCGGVGYDGLVLEGGWYTDCTGDDTKYNINPYGIYGEIRHIWSGETYHLYAGLDYDVDQNTLAGDVNPGDHYFFVNNLQFIPQSNLVGYQRYWYYTGGLQGILFDTYGGIGFIGERNCIFQGDNVVVPQGSFVTGYWHNDKLGEIPVWDSELLQCINGEFVGRTGYDYSTPLDCYTEDGVIIPHNSGHRMRESNVFTYTDRGYVYDVDYFVNTGGWTGAEYQLCWDGALSGNLNYKYANPQIASPRDCYFPETNKFIEHGTLYTGYKYLSTDFATSGNCQYGAVFQCFDGTIILTGLTWISNLDTGYSYEFNLVNSERTGYIYDKCVVLDPRQCVSPWGEVVEDGENVIAYQTEKEINGQGVCQSETRVCTDGNLSGTFQYETCQEVDLDKIPDSVSCLPQENLDLSKLVTSNDMLIKGLDEGVSVDINIVGSGTLFVNGVSTTGSATVSNGDIIKVEQLSSNEYDSVKSLTININGVKSFCVVKTKKNTETTFNDRYPRVIPLTLGQKRLIYSQYMNLLNKYSSGAYNMCSVTNSLTRIIGNILFEVNKGLITTSSNELRRVLWFKKQVLEYLLNITDSYRTNLVRTIIINSAGEQEEREVVGCNNE